MGDADLEEVRRLSARCSDVLSFADRCRFGAPDYSSFKVKAVKQVKAVEVEEGTVNKKSSAGSSDFSK